jgi:hypothetical protein
MYEQDNPNLVPPDSAYGDQVPRLGERGHLDRRHRGRAPLFILERPGKLSIWKPDGTVVQSGQLPVFSGNEDGALSISLDPNS